MHRRDSNCAIDACTGMAKDLALSGLEETDEDTAIPTIPCVKILLLGACGTGKTSLVTSFLQETFAEMYEPTQGVALSLRYSEVENRRVKMEIWDTSGHPSFQPQLAPYCRSAKAVLLVFNPAVRATFSYIQKAIQLIPAAYSCLVVSHRIGWDDDISNSEIERFCQAAKVKWMEVSAASGWNVQRAFEYLCRGAP